MGIRSRTGHSESLGDYIEFPLGSSYVSEGKLPIPKPLRRSLPAPRESIRVRIVGGPEFLGIVHSSWQRIDQLRPLIEQLGLKGGDMIRLSAAGDGSLLLDTAKQGAFREHSQGASKQMTLRGHPSEKELRSRVLRDLDLVEPGLQLFKPTGCLRVGRGLADIVAVDGSGRIVVVEVKSGYGGDSAIGQLLGYMSSVANIMRDNAVSTLKGVRGILIAERFTERAGEVARANIGVSLMTYELTGPSDSWQLSLRRASSPDRVTNCLPI